MSYPSQEYTIHSEGHGSKYEPECEYCPSFPPQLNFIALLEGDKLFNADHRTNEKAMLGWNNADWVKVEDLI